MSRTLLLLLLSELHYYIDTLFIHHPRPTFHLMDTDAVVFSGISASMHVTSSDEDCLLYAKQIKCRIIVAGSANERTRVLVFRSQLKHRLTVVQCSKEDFEKSEDVYSVRHPIH